MVGTHKLEYYTYICILIIIICNVSKYLNLSSAYILYIIKYLIVVFTTIFHNNSILVKFRYSLNSFVKIRS